jgi:hypothetical protein
VQPPTLIMTARGTSRLALVASSGAAHIISNPRYAKNTTEAPLNIPSKPKGAKGCQLTGLV